MKTASKPSSAPWVPVGRCDHPAGDGADLFANYDPLGFEAGDENLYRYVGNHPTNATDPSGLLECDDRLFWATKKLVDVQKKIEDHVNSVIADARTAYPKGTQDAGKKIARYVFDHLGKNKAGTGVGPGNKISELTEIESWLKDNLSEGTEKYTWKFKDTRYGESPLGIFSGIPAHLREAYADHSIAPTIKVGDWLIGTDKWGHFFQQGYWYFDLGLNQIGRLSLGLWLEGDQDCYKKPFYPDIPGKVLDVVGGAKEIDSRWTAAINSRFPDAGKMFPGVFGAASTGVISYADIQANEDGFRFYRDLAADPYGYQFNINRAIPLIRQWNEQLNKNRFVGTVKVNDKRFPPQP